MMRFRGSWFFLGILAFSFLIKHAEAGAGACEMALAAYHTTPIPRGITEDDVLRWQDETALAERKSELRETLRSSLCSSHAPRSPVVRAFCDGLAAEDPSFLKSVGGAFLRVEESGETLTRKTVAELMSEVRKSLGRQPFREFVEITLIELRSQNWASYHATLAHLEDSKPKRRWIRSTMKWAVRSVATAAVGIGFWSGLIYGIFEYLVPFIQTHPELFSW